MWWCVVVVQRHWNLHAIRWCWFLTKYLLSVLSLAYCLFWNLIYHHFNRSCHNQVVCKSHITIWICSTRDNTPHMIDALTAKAEERNSIKIAFDHLQSPRSQSFCNDVYYDMKRLQRSSTGSQTLIMFFNKRQVLPRDCQYSFIPDSSPEFKTWLYSSSQNKVQNVGASWEDLVMFPPWVSKHTCSTPVSHGTPEFQGNTRFCLQKSTDYGYYNHLFTDIFKQVTLTLKHPCWRSAMLLVSESTVVTFH